MKTKRLTELALFTALASIIFIIELQLPDLCPIPGIKLGLANIITVYAVYAFKPHEAVLIAVGRIMIGALFSGNISALIYSLSGAFLCMVGMLLLKKVIPIKYIPLCSVIGGTLHNIGQTAAAAIIMGSFAVVSYLPLLICSGAVAGAFTGMCAKFVASRRLKE